MKKLNITLSLLALLLLGTSCEKIFMEKQTDSDPVATFDYLWNKVDQQYSFFDLKGVDWDAVRDTYRPMVSDDISDDSLFSVLGAMLNTLNDGHTNLVAPFDVSHNDEVYRKMYENKNINSDVVVLNYLTVNYHTTGGFAHNAIRDGKIAYLRYSSFTNSITDDDLAYLTQRYANTQGMIIDLRQNGGGNVDNVWNLMKLLPNGERQLYRTQIKNGPAHDDFSELKTVSQPRHDDALTYNHPIAILTDRGSFSATSFFSLCAKSNFYDDVTIVGDTTGGGLGLPNGGELPNGWAYRFSITRTLDLNGDNWENGMPPDVTVILDPAQTAAGIDNVIEAACDLLLGEWR